MDSITAGQHTQIRAEWRPYTDRTPFRLQFHPEKGTWDRNARWTTPAPESLYPAACLFSQPSAEISSSAVRPIMRQEQPNLLRPLHPSGREQNSLNSVKYATGGSNLLESTLSVETADLKLGSELGRSGRGAASAIRLGGHEQQQRAVWIAQQSTLLPGRILFMPTSLASSASMSEAPAGALPWHARVTTIGGIAGPLSSRHRARPA